RTVDWSPVGRADPGVVLPRPARRAGCRTAALALGRVGGRLARRPVVRQLLLRPWGGRLDGRPPGLGTRVPSAVRERRPGRAAVFLLRRHGRPLGTGAEPRGVAGKDVSGLTPSVPTMPRPSMSSLDSLLTLVLNRLQVPSPVAEDARMADSLDDLTLG